jgi:hypothetical protein
MRPYSPFVAATLIMLALGLGLLAMPRIMLAASGAGPFAGLAIALAFILALFAVLWLRARHQRRSERG